MESKKKMKSNKYGVIGVLSMLLIIVLHNFHLSIQLTQVKDLLYEARSNNRNIEGLSYDTAENVSVLYDEIRDVKQKINRIDIKLNK